MPISVRVVARYRLRMEQSQDPDVMRLEASTKLASGEQYGHKYTFSSLAELVGLLAEIEALAARV